MGSIEPAADKQAHNASEDSSFMARIAFDGFGLFRKEREELFLEIANEATDTRLPFWLISLLSGAIATFGLLQNSSAVVIGAMLVAPFLGPLSGIALSLAVGETRLFVQSTVTIVLAALAIILLAAGLTMLMPVAPMTDQISSRTQPNLIDLLIAITSGSAAAVVNASRNSRFTASLPGVAMAVALVPPLAVAGYGLGAGWNFSVFNGALLLFGVNLAGIILSGELIYIALGMAQASLKPYTEEWNRRGHDRGMSVFIGRLVDNSKFHLGNLRRRVVLTLMFVALVSIPLFFTFSNVIEEYRLGEVVNKIEKEMERHPHTHVIDRSADTQGATPEITLDVASRTPIDQGELDRYQEMANQIAGEPVKLTIVQQSYSNSADLADAEKGDGLTSGSASLPDTVNKLDQRLSSSMARLSLPPKTSIISLQLGLAGPGQPVTYQIILGFGGPDKPSSDALDIVRQQAANAIGAPISQVGVRLQRIGSASDLDNGDIAALMQRFPSLVLYIPQSGDAAPIGAELRRNGISADRIKTANINAASGDSPCLAPARSTICQ